MAKILVLLFLVGCSEQATSYTMTPELIRQIESGDSHVLNHPEPEQFLAACKVAGFRENLKELGLSHDLSRYTSTAISDLGNLTKAELFGTSNTDGFMAALPAGIETLNLIQTDISSVGLGQIGRFRQLRHLHFSPWRNDCEGVLFEALEGLSQFKTVGVEWIDESALKRLRNRFPNIEITRYPAGG